MKERRTDDYQIQIVHTLTKCGFVEEGVFGREFGRKPNRTYLMNLITFPPIEKRFKKAFLLLLQSCLPEVFLSSSRNSGGI